MPGPVKPLKFRLFSVTSTFLGSGQAFPRWEQNGERVVLTKKVYGTSHNNSVD
jgi:hypothetical protein